LSFFAGIDWLICKNDPDRNANIFVLHAVGFQLVDVIPNKELFEIRIQLAFEQDRVDEPIGFQIEIARVFDESHGSQIGLVVVVGHIPHRVDCLMFT
jgi:hypothetical protein